ncbi:hypothetical protein F5Y15DRAFT_418260 [Xylariaceae sp. FL0016]|nr:hypothetical protein F5Y15DRAFT_418260 [Xylariaceae sp. FL0016]
MPNPHTIVAITQTVLYAPLAPFSIFILIRNRDRPPSVTWNCLVLYTCMRLAGGPVTITYQNAGGHVEDAPELYRTSLVLLNVGLVPLLVATHGLVLQVFAESRQPASLEGAVLLAKLARASYLSATLLVGVGDILASDGVNQHTGHLLDTVGHVMSAATLALLLWTQVLLWHDRTRHTSVSVKILRYMSCPVPFLTVRTVYALLYIYTQDDADSTWNPVNGSPVAFALLALLMEFVVMGLYMWTGLKVPRRLVSKEDYSLTPRRYHCDDDD